MLKIGDFARAARVTIKTLRYYAREGLLTPVYIDRYSGYRYYTLDQLPTLNRILALKDLGFSLAQIRQLLAETLTAEELRGMLRVKQGESERLQRVEERLEMIDREARASLSDILFCRDSALITHTIKETEMEPVRFETLPAFTVMGMKYRGNNANQEIARMWGRLNPRAHEIPMTGECAYGVCLMLNDAPAGVFEYVAGFKVEQYDRVPEGMVVIDVPENRYAVFAHRGSLQTLKDTYAAICDDWFLRSGYKPTGGYDMEVYTDEFKDFAPDSVFYIYEPVK
jgi:predicted transcriptional regulator YdeE